MDEYSGFLPNSPRATLVANQNINYSNGTGEEQGHTTLTDLSFDNLNNSLNNNEIISFLQEWGMPNLFDRITKAGIYTLNAFRYMTERDLDMLFSSNELELKIMFRKHLTEWRVLNGIGYPNSLDAPDNNIFLKKIYDFMNHHSSSSSDQSLDDRDAPSPSDFCWENCELLQSNFQVWGAMCEEKEICFPGCQQACKFHQEASSRGQQSQPVIHTKGEAVINVNGARAQWPSKPLSADPDAPVVYVVMRKSQAGPWRQIIQTLDSGTRVPVDQGNALLRVLVVDPQGLLTIYSPDEQSLKSNKKKKKTINTEIKATTSKSINSDEDAPWILKEISLIHQKVLVIGEIAWEPKTTRGVYLVTWEVDGGGLKGNLFTDTTCVTLSLWPDTIYHIQVELVSRIPGVENLKSQMMDLDTGRAQKVSTETDVNILPEESPKEGDLNSPLLSVLFSAVRGEHVRQTYRRVELVMGVCVAIVVFAIVLALILWRWRNRGAIIDNMITGSTNVRGQKLVEDLSAYSDFHPIVTVLNTSVVEEPPTPPEILFQGHPSHFSSQLEKKTVQV